MSDPASSGSPLQNDSAVATSRIERFLSHARFQRTFALVFAAIGVACAVVVAAVALSQGTTGLPVSSASLPRAVVWMDFAMRILLVLVSGCLGFYLALLGYRRALTRMLASSCAAIAAGLGVFHLTRLVASSFVSSLRSDDVATFQLILGSIFIVVVFLMSVWIFSTTKFFLFFPKPVKLLDMDAARWGSHQDETLKAPRHKAGWKWMRSPQFVALAVGILVILLLDTQGDRLPSARWNDASTYFLCWLPFAAISAKQKHLNEEDRRSIRWVVLGQALWLVLFLLALMAVYALRASEVLSFANWTDSEQFNGALLGFFFAGFIVVLIVSLAFSILYHGTLDPDLMIRRTWILAAFGITSGFLFVMLERLLAGLVASWLDISALNALTVVGLITAAVIFPLRAWLEGAARRLIERWQSVHALADGVRRDAVIVFADLSGYTALTEQNEREALIMAAIFHRDAQVEARAHRGVLIKTIGDAVMLRFSDVENAYKAVNELKRAFRTHVEAMSLAPLAIHAAIHRGEVVEGPAGDVFGAAVNLAARLLGAAGPNDIIASHAALGGTALADQAKSLGERRFKNVELPVACFRLA